MRLWSQESDANLDRGIVLKICNLAKGLDMNKVVLFGSRATKMNGERSDIDLMISEKNASVKAAFINGLEDINTLLIFDVVNASIRSLLNPELTASWEKGLAYVAEGSITPEEYMVKLEDFIRRRTEAVMHLNNQFLLKNCLLCFCHKFHFVN